LRLAVSNLVRNAAVHAGAGRRQAHVAVTIAPSEVEPVVRVDDDGPGIDPADRERLLRPFERGPASAGSGLGLALVSRVARLHGGELRLGESQLGGLCAELALRTDAGVTQ
jgi:signal transduction histidine kinase